MFYAVRLRPFNKKKGNKMKSYLSASRTKYKVGEFGKPSPIRIVTCREELRELSEKSQFEMIGFETKEELNRFLNRESLRRVKKGLSPTRPAILGGPKAKEDHSMNVDKDLANGVDEDPGDDGPTPESIFDNDNGVGKPFEPENIEDSYDNESSTMTPKEPEKDFAPKEKAKKKNTGRKSSKQKKTSKKTSKKS